MTILEEPPAPYTPLELRDRLNRALQSTVRRGEHWVEMPFLMRRKPRQYYDVVEKLGVEEPYAYFHKRPSGHPASVVNYGRTKGLFFHGKPQNYTPFGPRQMTIDSSFLIHPAFNNVYFADFYCTTKGKQRKRHEVTLVVARIGSKVDKLLSQRYKLPCITKDQKFITNPWLRQHGSSFIVFNTGGLRVEFMITESISLDDLKATFTDVRVHARCSGRSFGVNHNERCKTCN